jgi:hypothetical protein
MLFNDKKVFQQVDDLRLEVIHLKSIIQTQQTMTDALVKLVKARYGVKQDGTPKKKPGRKLKVAV